MDKEQKIEALLFYRGDPVKIAEIAKLIKTSEEEVEAALEKLEESLSTRGIRLMRANEAVSLVTAPELGGLMETIAKEEVSRDLGKAGLETLSIVIYLSPVSRSRIDWIRGVNSSFIIRNLLVRGLIERITNPDDSRAYLYRPSFDLLSHLGVTKVEDLPEYEKNRSELLAFEETPEKEETAGNSSEGEGDEV